MANEMTHTELLDLPVSFDLATAGRAFGIGRAKAYELARTGRFPCKVLSVGATYRVTRSALLTALGIDPDTVLQPPRRRSPKRQVRAGADLDRSPAA
jgi:hypothetical protein